MVVLVIYLAFVLVIIGLLDVFGNHDDSPEFIEDDDWRVFEYMDD